MTIRDKAKLLELLNLADKELDCNGNCYGCYYGLVSHEANLDNCPLRIAFDMINTRYTNTLLWESRKG